MLLKASSVSNLRNKSLSKKAPHNTTALASAMEMPLALEHGSESRWDTSGRCLERRPSNSRCFRDASNHESSRIHEYPHYTLQT